MDSRADFLEFSATDGMVSMLPSSVIESHGMHENDDQGVQRRQSGEIVASLQKFGNKIFEDREGSQGLCAVEQRDCLSRFPRGLGTHDM